MTPEYITAVAALVSALSWPLVSVVILVLFRHPITRLLNRMKRANVAGGEIHFETEETVAEIKVAADSLRESAEIADAPASAPIDRTMLEMIAADPREAIIFSWHRLQEALIDLADEHGEWIDLRSMKRSAEKLIKAGALSTEMAEAITSLYSTYKRALRANDFYDDDGSVEQFVRLTLKSRDAIKVHLRELQHAAGS